MNGSNEAKQLIRRLRRMGLEIAISSGSNHYRVTNPATGGTCSISCSPSTKRFFVYSKLALKQIGVKL